MPNWSKQSGIPFAKEKITSVIEDTGQTTNHTFHTITFEANELKVGDTFDLYIAFEATKVVGDVVAQISLGENISVNRFSSIAVSTSGTRSYFMYKKFFVVSPTIIKVADDAIISGIGGGSDSVKNITVDITTGIIMTFTSGMTNASDSLRIEGLTIMVTK